MKTLTQHRHLRDQLTLGLILGAIAFVIIALGLAVDHLTNLYAASHPPSPPPSSSLALRTLKLQS